MGVIKNKYIEEWAHNRVTLEERFRWNRRNLVGALVFCVLVPYGLFRLTVKAAEGAEPNHGPELYGRQRYYIGGTHRLPEERREGER